MENAERFLSTFNQIDKHLRAISKENRTTPFSSVLETASKKDSMVRRFKTDLHEFADLRNAIVHERTDGHVIAEPLDYTVKELNTIYELLTNPPKAFSFKQIYGEVFTIDYKSKLTQALGIMSEYKFSQIPVLKDSKIHSLLTSNTISLWLAGNIPEDIISITETSIEDVLNYSEYQNNFILADRTVSVIDVLEKFKQIMHQDSPLCAVIMTHNGRTNEKPLKIFTVWDVPFLENTFYDKLKQ